MTRDRGEVDPVGAIVVAVIVTIIALLGVYLFSQLDKTIIITGSLSETGQDLLTDTAEVLAMAVGGTSIAVSTALYLQMQAG